MNLEFLKRAAAPRASATPVLRTPPLVARAAPPAVAPTPEAPQSAFAGGLTPERRERQAIDLGDAPSTSTLEAPREDAAPQAKPSPQPNPPGRIARVENAKAPAQGGSQRAGLEIHSESSSSRVAGGVTREPDDAQANGNVPQENGSTPQENGGTPQENGGTPQENGGTPQENGGTPQESGSTPQENGGVPQENGSTPQPTETVREDTPLAPAAGSALPERAQDAISSRTTTSDTNALSPLPAEAQLPEPSVGSPLPSLTGAVFNTVQSGGGITRRTGEDAELAPVGIAGPPLASGDEGGGSDFSLTSDNPVITDLERGISLAQGNVVLSYGAFRATGKRGVAYLNATPRIATLSDDLVITAKVRGREQTFRGESLTFNLDTGRWDLGGLRATFPPDLFPRGQVLEPLFLRDARVFGQDDQADGSDLKFSSCDEDHYFLSSRALNFYRDERGNPDRIVLKKNALYVFGKKVLPLPNYVYSLNSQGSRRNALQPQVGRNQVDGFFAKTTYDFAATNARTDSLLIDALQKRGLGLGIQRELANGAGLLYLYGVSGKGISSSTGNAGGREVNARLARDFSIGRELRSSLRFDSSTNNSLSGAGFSNSNGTFSLEYLPTSGNGGGNLEITTANNKNPLSAITQRSGSLTLQRQVASDWNVSLSSRYNASTSTLGGLGAEASTDRQETLDNTLGVGRAFGRFDAALEAELHDDLTGVLQRNGAYALERLPELLLTSNSQRLGGGLLDKIFPGRVRLSLGDFNEPATEQRLGRTRFEYAAQQRPLRLVQKSGVRSRFEVGGGFVQSAYSNDTARYDYNADVSFVTELGREKRGRNGENATPFQLRANYRKLKPTGYTPFQFDFLAPNEFTDVRGIIQPSSKARLELAGGRDIQSGISRPVTGTLRLLPSRSVSFDVSAAYSLEEGEFNDLNSNLLLTRARRVPPGSAPARDVVQLGVRYSPQQGTLSTINMATDVQLGSKTRFQSFTNYNGFSKQFELNQFRVVRDLHCFNLYASYDAQRKQVRLDLALKAFPFVDSRLGQSVLGEGFDPAIGTVR